ncbi:MAG: hypothetical protein U1F67_10455 [Rubrivivax sp.]
MDKPDPKGALAAILQQNLSKNPELAAKQRRLLELLRQQQRQQQQGLATARRPMPTARRRRASVPEREGELLAAQVAVAGTAHAGRYELERA